jgi:hypothetical protein
LALLIGTSASMELNLAVAQEAAIGFVRELSPVDVASLIDFDTRVQVLQGFTSDQAALEAAIRKRRPAAPPRSTTRCLSL